MTSKDGTGRKRGRDRGILTRGEGEEEEEGRRGAIGGKDGKGLMGGKRRERRSRGGDEKTVRTVGEGRGEKGNEDRMCEMREAASAERNIFYRRR